MLRRQWSRAFLMVCMESAPPIGAVAVVVVAAAAALRKRHEHRNRRQKPPAEEAACTARPHPFSPHQLHRCGTKAAGEQPGRLHLRLRPCSGHQPLRQRGVRGRGAGAMRPRAVGAAAGRASGAAVRNAASAGPVASAAPEAIVVVRLLVGLASRCRLRLQRSAQARTNSTRCAVAVGREPGLGRAAAPPLAGKASASALALLPHLCLLLLLLLPPAPPDRTLSACDGGRGRNCAGETGTGSAVAASVTSLEQGQGCRNAAGLALSRTPVSSCCKGGARAGLGGCSCAGSCADCASGVSPRERDWTSATGAARSARDPCFGGTAPALVPEREKPTWSGRAPPRA